MENYALSIIKIGKILLVTVPSDPDDNIINILQERVLESFEKNQSKGVILDVSTVETMDSFFARVIAETVQMIELMGGLTIIAGMTASVAITTTQLGLSIGNALTALNVDKAIAIINKKIKEE
jgi:rsbT antagonist protein RsbS